MTTMDKLIAHSKQYGFVYQGSEIYNGQANTWDYGPLGVELKRNILNMWWNHFVKENKLNVGLDSTIMLNNQVWKASGHIGGFSDPLTDCKECNTRYRADKLVEEFDNDLNPDGWSNSKLLDFIMDNKIVCPSCGALNYTEIRHFNLMFQTNMGVIENEHSKVYLRPETAQGIFINFKNIARTTRKKIPFGVGQIGKSFRNEITPGNFIFRTREFEQMELEFFCKPGTEMEWFDFYEKEIKRFLDKIGINEDNYRIKEHKGEELSHYSNKTIDYEYKYPFGYGELWGLASRTDFDLNAHQEASKQDMTYMDPQTNEKYLPYVIEPAVSVDRLMLALLVDAFVEEELEDGTTRDILKFNPLVAPVQIAIMPLVKKLGSNCDSLYANLASKYRVEYDEAGSIGKRYRRQDVIGTPYCLTFDYDSLDDASVTVRDRDTMSQERIKLEDLEKYFALKMGF